MNVKSSVFLRKRAIQPQISVLGMIAQNLIFAMKKSALLYLISAKISLQVYSNDLYLLLTYVRFLFDGFNPSRRPGISDCLVLLINSGSSFKEGLLRGVFVSFSIISS